MVDVVDAFVSGVAAFAGYDMDSIQDVQIAACEAAINAIIHGNGRDVWKQVRVKLAVNTMGLEICVQDQGRGFDPSEVPDPLASDNLCKSSGRGILFMRSLMDEVSIVRDAEGGTQVRMVKRRARVARQPGAVSDAA
jgi:serine/threonine-protein kinase RsbW